jgi:hypothetical protein
MMAAFMARKIKEPDSRQTSEMVANLPTHVRSPRTLKG